MDFMYNGWLSIYSASEYESNSIFSQVVGKCLHNFIILAQNTRFFWYPDMPISNFQSYVKVWKAIGCSSPDLLAAALGTYQSFSISIIVIIYTPFVLVALSCVLVFFKKTVPYTLAKIIRILLFIVCDLCFIPIILDSFVILKYSTTHNDNMSEYGSDVQSNQADFGVFGQLIGLLNLGVFLLMSAFYEACSVDVRPSLSKNCISIKANTSITIMRKVNYLINAGFFVSIQSSYYSSYLVGAMFMYGGYTLLTLMYLPYYSFISNFLEVFTHFDCFCIIIFFYVGVITDNAYTIVLLALLMQIPILSMVYGILKYRISKIQSISISKTYNYAKFEQSAREVLVNGNLKKDFIKIINKNYKIYKNKLNKISQAYYCNDILNSCALGLVKIHSIDHKGFNILVNFQVFKCKKVLIQLCRTSSEGFKFLQHFTDFEKIKKQEKYLCERYNTFLNEVLENDRVLSRLKNHIDIITSHIKLIEENYVSLLSRFSGSAEAKEMFGSFLLNIIRENERAQVYLAKSNSKYKRSLGSSSKNSLVFTDSRCFLVISGNSDTVGKFLYSNMNLLSFLGIPPEAFNDYALSNFIPNYLKKGHDGYLLKFVDQSTDTIVYEDKKTFFINTEGFLLECLVNAECIANENSVYFVCSIDPVSSHGVEIAIINEEGNIYAHSKQFTEVLETDKKYIQDRYIQEFIPGFDISKLTLDDLHEFQLKCTQNAQAVNKTVTVYINNITIGSQKLIVLYACGDISIKSQLGNKFKSFYKLESSALKKTDFEESDSIEEQEKVIKFNDEDIEINMEKKLELDNKSKQTSFSSSTSFLTIRETKALKNSIKVLKITKYVVFLSVIYK
jgi:hypothetical protein